MSIGFILLLPGVSSFTSMAPTTTGSSVCQTRGVVKNNGLSSSRLYETKESSPEGGEEITEEEAKSMKVEAFLEKKYPSFYTRLMNEDIRKALNEDKATVFVPNEAAFEALGEKKLLQIGDPRNEEIREKMGSYHIVPGVIVSAMELKTEDWTKGRPKDGSKPNTVVAGIKTQSGEVPCGREKSGGILGWGAKADGDFVVGPAAKIVQSFNVGDYLVHEMDDLISPLALWRYCDQLRIL